MMSILNSLRGATISPGIALDADAVYALGFSNGAFMASMLGMKVPWLRGFAALAGHQFELPASMTPRVVSIYWRTTDQLIHYGGCCASQQPKCCCGISDRWTGACIGAEEIFQYWLRTNGCKGYAISSPRYGVTCKDGAACLKPVQFCTYNYGFHQQSFEGHQQPIGDAFAHDACEIVGGQWAAFNCQGHPPVQPGFNGTWGTPMRKLESLRMPAATHVLPQVPVTREASPMHLIYSAAALFAVAMMLLPWVCKRKFGKVQAGDERAEIESSTHLLAVD
jgi:hypothetical protein